MAAKEHKAKIRPESKFKKLEFKPFKGYDGLRMRGGPTLGGDGSFQIQSMLFDTEEFTARDAQEWLRRHKYAYSNFEAASVAPTA